MTFPTIRRNAIQVSRTAYYHSVGPSAREAKEVWFVLHGYGQLASYFVRHFQGIADEHRLIIAPEALSRFYVSRDGNRVGASWMTREAREDEIKDYLAYLNQVYDAMMEERAGDPVRITVLGFSQGGATASRWVTLGGLPACRLILWGGAIAHDLDLKTHGSVFNRLQLTMVVGNEDEFVTPDVLEEQKERLDGAQIRYRLIPFKGGHRLNPDILKKVATPHE